jgi:pheromone shutdown protein TraB
LINEFVLSYLDNSAEIIAAIDVANEIGAEIALIDRDILIPIYKFFNDLARIKRAKLSVKLPSLYGENEDSFEKLEDLFYEFSPSLYEENFLKNTNSFIAKKLLDIQEENVVAVVRAKN